MVLQVAGVLDKLVRVDDLEFARLADEIISSRIISAGHGDKAELVNV
jgi:hypothetical protein